MRSFSNLSQAEKKQHAKNLASSRSLFGKNRLMQRGLGQAFTKTTRMQPESPDNFSNQNRQANMGNTQKLNQFTNLMLYSNNNRAMNLNGTQAEDQIAMLSQQARNNLRGIKDTKRFNGRVELNRR